MTPRSARLALGRDPVGVLRDLRARLQRLDVVDAVLLAGELRELLQVPGQPLRNGGGIGLGVAHDLVDAVPLRPEVDARSIPDDDRAMLNLIFLKYANVDELSKLIGEFLGPEGKAWSYPPANLLLLLDSRRSMRRTMEMISLFDSDTLAKQRVKLFEVKYSVPSDLAKELGEDPEDIERRCRSDFAEGYDEDGGKTKQRKAKKGTAANCSARTAGENGPCARQRYGRRTRKEVVFAGYWRRCP